MRQPSYRRLQQYAIAISIASILYNGAEGAISIAFGSESSSLSLIFFGVQSGIEVISAFMVLWRFKKVAKPGEEKEANISPQNLRLERIASSSIGVLLVLLSLATLATSIASLVLHEEANTSTSSLIISASALVIMILIWLPKRYLARTLDSSAMKGEATCSLSCIQITIVLFAGSLIRKLWAGGWWVDSATSIILGFLFGWEAFKLIKWVRDPEFDGGCCKDCGPKPVLPTEELQERYRDLCECCSEKSECKDAGECQCQGFANDPEHQSCCSPRDMNGAQCCTHQILPGVRQPRPTPPVALESQEDPCECCNECEGEGDGEGEGDERQIGTVEPQPGPQASTCCTVRPDGKTCCT